MTLALDGSQKAINSGQTSISVTLTTSLTDDIIIAIVYNEKNNASFVATTSVSGGSLTWTKYTEKQLNGSGSKGDFSVWWAHAPSALSSVSITANFSQSSDDSYIVAFGVNGANTTTPFDGNASLPSYNTNDGTSGNSTVETTGVTISAANSFEVWTYGSWVNCGADVPTGFTQIQKPQNGGGSLFAFGNVGYKLNTSAPSGVTRTSTGSTAWQKWQALSFALVEPGGGPSEVNLSGDLADDDGLSGILDVPIPLALDTTGNLNVSVVSSTDFNIDATSGADRIIVITIHSEQQLVTLPDVVSVTSPNLTWTKRGELTYTASISDIHQNLETWWAHAADPVANETVTVTWNTTIDDATLSFFSVSGVDPSRYSNPFDDSVTLPLSDYNVSGSNVAPSVSLTTGSADTFAFLAWGVATLGVGNNAGPPTGWDEIKHTFNGGATNYSQHDVYGKIYSTTQSGTSVVVTGTTSNWGVLLDAITRIGGGAPEFSIALSDDNGLEGSLLVPLDLSGDLSDDFGITGILTVEDIPNFNGPQLIVICTGT